MVQYRALNQTSTMERPRVPTALQTVFLKSNRGKDVNLPPPMSLATKTFTSNWDKDMYESSTEKVLSVNNKKATEHTSAKLQHEQRAREAAAAAARLKKALEMDLTQDYTLQEYFDSILVERGYKITPANTLETAYNNDPSDLQIASYGPRMIQIVKSGDCLALRETLGGGLSANPCNQFGESLVHMACRRGNIGLLEVFCEAGGVLQVSDDYGRTVLHDACWAARPCFDVVKKILMQDSFLFFMKDRRGALPLSYVPKAHWTEWKEWLAENIDTFYPESLASGFGPSELASLPPNSFPVPDCKSQMSLELIKMVANGDMSPREARITAEEANRCDDDATVAMTVGDSEYGDSDDESDFDSDFDSDCDSDYDSDDEMEEGGAMFEMLQIAQGATFSH